jgi:uncharacterized protein (UPF0332 family)
LNEEVKANLDRSEESILVARELYDSEHYDFSASRAYYSVFYAATALLLAKGFTFKRHSGVISAIHQRFVKTGLIDREIGKDLNWLFELRNIGDYGEIRHVPQEDAEKAIIAADRFVQTIQALI